MPQLYLHIGTPKTGTTTLQNALYDNKEYLHSRGIHVAQSSGIKNSRLLPAYCTKEHRFDDFFRKRGITSIQQKNTFRKDFRSHFTEEIKNLPKTITSVIISSEQLYSRTTSYDEIQNVRNFLIPFFDRIKVICYVREQTDMCVSSFSTAIKSGNQNCFKAYLDKCHSDNKRYNYFKVLSAWRDIFGADNLKVRIYDKQLFKQNSLVNDFFSLIDPSFNQSLLKSTERHNTSLSAFGQLLGITINQRIPIWNTNGTRNAIRGQIMQFVSEHFKGTGLATNKQEYDKIYSSFDAANQLLNEQFLNGTRRQNCFKYQPPASQDDTLTQNYRKLTDLFCFVENSDHSKLSFPDYYADHLRDIAIMLEHDHLDTATQFMKLARMIRPNGVFIAQKVRQYTQRE
jgi:hypothetical protein